jgi:hypothetical protein
MRTRDARILQADDRAVGSHLRAGHVFIPTATPAAMTVRGGMMAICETFVRRRSGSAMIGARSW